MLEGSAVQTVQGAPIFVPQPVGVPVGVGVGGGAVAAALPWGLSLFGGTNFEVDGDLIQEKDFSPNNLNTGQVFQPDTSYDDAFSEGWEVGAALERDLSPNTTIFGQGVYGEKSGGDFENGTFQQGFTDPNTGVFVPGTFDAQGNFFPGQTQVETITSEVSDLETITLEAGLRQYFGPPKSIRPYLAATAGAVYNDDVTITNVSSGGTLTAEGNTFELIDSGWNPTASGLIGLETAVGTRGAIGVEGGIRWQDGVDTLFGGADDRISLPLRLRGRVAF